MDAAEDGTTLMAEGTTSLKQFKSCSKRSVFSMDEVLRFTFIPFSSSFQEDQS